MLFKGGLHLEHLSVLRALAVDKTGTLTQGKPVVTDFIVRDGVERETALAILAGIESQSNHPLAQAITSYAKAEGIDVLPQATIEDIPGWGIKGTIQNKEYQVGKPEFVDVQLANNFANSAVTKLAAEGKTVIFIRDQHGIVALTALKDTVRPEAKRLLHY